MIFKRKLLGILLTACMIAGLFGHMMTTAFAADPATLTVSGGSCEVGHSVEVKVKVSAPDAIGIVQFTLTYDTDMLECEGYSGKIQELDTDIKDKSKTYTYKFRGKKEGTASIKVSGVEILPLNGGDAFEGGVKASDGSVTVKAPYVASTNAYLKSLSVEQGKISPSFSKDTYEYSMELDGKYSKVSVSAKAEDDKASVSVSGNKDLKEGKNTVSVTVTAEDGKTKKTYKITVTRGPVPTSTPTPSPSPSPTPTPSATPTPGLTVQVDAEELTLMDQITAELPEGFSAEDTDVDGYHVAVASSDGEDTKLVQLSDGKLYTYTRADDGTITCAPYITLGGDVRKYLYIGKPDSVELPQGFSESEVTAFGERIPAYRADADSTMFLSYLRSPEGNEGWYLIDAKEQTIQRYSEELYSVKEEVPPEEPEPTPTGVPDDPEQPTPPVSPTIAPNGDGGTNPAPVKSTSGGGFWKLIESLSQRERIGVGIIAILLLLCVLLGVLLLIGHNRHAKEYDAEETEEDDIPDEPVKKNRKGEKAALAAAVPASKKSRDAEAGKKRPKREYVAEDDTEDDMGTTFDPRLLAGGEAAHKANVDKAMKAMRDAEVAEKKAKKAVKEAKESLDRVDDPKKAKKAVKDTKAPDKGSEKKSVNYDDYDEEDYL
ncbi:MAG: cadherin-like beta sandwich domain-containing protein [Lachnospiraceae bacterium]|nr:cadherin-like beta sandwich domain-containing protein [Lachnospiraceae bacterium]